MTISPSSLRVFVASTNDAVDFFQLSDLGKSFDFIFTFSEGIRLDGSGGAITGNLSTYVSFAGVFDPGGGTTVIVRGTLKSDLTIDVAQATLGIAGGFETVSGDDIDSTSIAITNQSGDPLQFRLGTTPEITTGNGATATISIDENTTFVTNVDTNDDGNVDPASITYSLGGADAALFTISASTGELAFKSAPSFETPQDSGGNNVYDVTVTATDVIGQTDTQNISITVQDVNDAPTGSVTVSGTPTQGETLTAGNTLADEDGLGTVSYQWQRDGVDIDSATGATYTLSQADVDAKITVVVSYTDGRGTSESVASTATAAVENINDNPTGSVTISGTAEEDQTLTASNTLADIDGLGTITYQWKRDGVDIDGAIGATLTLTQADVGAVITVLASYTDGHETLESMSSAGTATVANVNDAPTGSVTITGTPTQGETLTAANTLADEDGLGTVSYQWQRDGVDIDSATGATFTLTQADVDAEITVVAKYTDGEGTAESVASSATASVANINDAPTGSVTITGTPMQGETLTAGNSLADTDGLGTITYQWQRDGVDIDGATGATYTLSQADVDAEITVLASYTDGHGTSESVVSAETAVIANVNDAPTGSVTISGTPKQGEKLTAGNSLADADGLGVVSYQWQRDGVDIDGASDATYTLTQADVDAEIIVMASYTDGFGVNESVASAATSFVANVNEAPTGGVTITGTPTQGETLTAGNSLADADGLGVVSYQWQRDGVEIDGASDNTYTLTQADVDAEITVVASYTDSQGTSESVSSTASAAVANINDAPTGSVTITGIPRQGETLTAGNSLADADGLGTISYQWQRDGVDIGGVTGATYTLTQADVDAAIAVVATYTDGQGKPETVASIPTEVVENVNDAPAGAGGSVSLLQGGSHVFSAADFGFSDIEGDKLAAVVIGTLPASGLLTLDGQRVRAGDEIAIGQIGALMWTPDAGDYGADLASLDFQVRDGGGTENGGTDLSDVQTLGFDVTQIVFMGSGDDDTVVGTPHDNIIDAMGGNDSVRPGEGADIITLGTGTDLLIGTLSELDGDRVTDFDTDSGLQIEGMTGGSVSFNDETGTLTLVEGRTTARIALDGDFTGGTFLSFEEDGDTLVFFETWLPQLADKQTLDADQVNGIANQEFLSGRDVDFSVTLQDMGYSKFDSSLGVYEIDEAGNIVDVRLLFAYANADKSASTTIGDIEAGHDLGFFLVSDGASDMKDIDADASLAFVNGDGEAASLSDGDDLVLSLDGVALSDLLIFHSYDAEMNADGLTHVVSGVTQDGNALLVGFEDILGGGDRDYEDLAFRIEESDPLLM